MQIIRQLNHFPETLRGGAISIGKFDGMHLGHSLIVRRLTTYANQRQIPSIVVTFDLPPLAVLKPELDVRPICTLERKLELIQSFNVDAVVVLPTTRELLQCYADEFFRTVIKQVFGAKIIVEGTNFSFGKNRSGNAETIQEFGSRSGIEVDIVELIQIGEQRISSSKIRQLIQEGQLDSVCELMSQPYRLTGRVVKGDERGRTLGFPTANLADVKTILPKQGIYATAARIDGKRYAATTHIGTVPTFERPDVRVEVFVHQFSGDLYGKELSVDFYAFLRDITKFGNIDALVQQMKADIQRSEHIVGLTSE